MAPKTKIFPSKLPSFIRAKLSSKSKGEKNSINRKQPNEVANKATKNPMSISFFIHKYNQINVKITNSSCLIFAKNDVRSNQIEQEPRKHNCLPVPTHRYLRPCPY